MTFKEINLNKEFEIEGYEYKIPCGSDGLNTWIDFLYSPSESFQDVDKYSGNVVGLIRSAYVSVNGIYLDRESKQDIYGIMDNFIIKKIETKILEDLMK